MLETHGGKSSIAVVFTLVIYHAHQPNQSFLFSTGDECIIQIRCKTDNTDSFYTHALVFIYSLSHLSMRESPRDLERRASILRLTVGEHIEMSCDHLSSVTQLSFINKLYSNGH